MDEPRSTGYDYQELFARAYRTTTDADAALLIAEIDERLAVATDPLERGRLLMCRARVQSNRWRTSAVFEDTRAAMRCFEMAGEGGLVIDAASWAAAHASRLGELAVAAELATRGLVSLEWIDDERLRMEVHNRLGIFCVSFLDYDRAIEQFEASLAVAERLGDTEKICRQMHNMADVLLLIARQRRLAGVGTGEDELARAEVVVRSLLALASDAFLRRGASYRLLAEALCERGRPDEALAVLEEYRDRPETVTAQVAALAWIEARCLRLTGRAAEALVQAERAVDIVQASDDDHELMLALEELAACQEASGQTAAALETARNVKTRLWLIHQRQTKQLVAEVWGRADLVRDQAALQSQAAEALRRSEEDALTGIPNRRVLENFLDGQGPTRSVALLVLDVDHFKDVNDGYGHQVGDAVLRRIGRILAEEMRSDQVSVRFGGDEFVVGLLGAGRDGALGFAERLRHKLESVELDALGPKLRVTASIGVALGLCGSWRNVLTEADEALYAAKHAGRNRVMAAPVGFHRPR